MENRNKTLMSLVECALFLAAAVALDYFKLVEMPLGGSIKFVMIPLVLVSFRQGPKWGVGTSIAYVIIAMILGRQDIMYAGSAGAIVIAAFADYILAYGVIGLASLFARLFKNRTVGVAMGTVIVCFIRFIGHFISGVTVWASYMPEEWNDRGLILYSIVYNGAYMLPITIVTVVVMVVLYKAAPQLFTTDNTMVGKGAADN